MEKKLSFGELDQVLVQIEDWVFPLDLSKAHHLKNPAELKTLLNTKIVRLLKEAGQ